jgi:hypothetical protein
MPALTQQSAGVRFREIDLSQSLVSASTAVGAMVFVSSKGRPGLFNVTTWGDFVAEYGERNAQVSFGHYCAKDFFDEGNSLWCLRALNTDAAYSAILLKDVAGVTTFQAISGGIADPTNINWTTYTTGASPMLMFYPKSGPGSWANQIALKVRSQNFSQPAAPTATSQNTGGTLAAATFSYKIAAVSAIGDTLASTAATVTIASGSTNQVTVTWSAVADARGYKVFGRTSGSEALITTVGAGTTSFIDTGALTPDSTQLPITNAGNLPAPDPTFTLEVYDYNLSTGTPQETWTLTLTDYTDTSGRQLEAHQQLNAFSSYIGCATYVPNLGSVPVVKAVGITSMAGGTSGTTPTNSQIANAWTNYFSDPQTVGANIFINAGYTNVTVQQTMYTVAQSRGDAIAILDMPSTMQLTQDAITYRQLVLNANTSYAAIYSSDVFVLDTYNNKQIYIPPSGKVAAVYARTDRVGGPQYAPAGLNRGQVDVLSLRQNYNDSQRTQLFQAQVNYLRTFVGAGTAVFEQVTLQSKQSALSWVNVRRMINVIKTGVKNYLMYSIHEPNDDFLRRQIVTSLTSYLQYWKDARGLLDFQVVCDSTNNPDSKYNLGILTVTIFITPVIAVHEIGVDIVITKAGVSFKEINISALG